MVNTLAEHPSFLSIYAAQRIWKFRGWRMFLQFGVFHRSLLENRNYIDLNIFLHHKDLYVRYGGFDESLRGVEDWDLILRYTQEHFPLALDCILGSYYARWDSGRVTKPKERQANLTAVYSNLGVKPLQLVHLQQASPSGARRFFSNQRAQANQEKEMPGKVSVIIPSYEVLECLQTCVEALQTYTEQERFELVIVDNGSSPPVVEYLNSLQKNKQAKVVFNTYNMGFTYAVNQAVLQTSPDRDIVLMNNDAIVTEGWLDALMEVKSEVSDVGIIVPRQVLPPFSKTMKTHVPFCLEEGELDVNLSQHHHNVSDFGLVLEKGYMELTFAPFFCVYITRACLEKVGLLDQKQGRHYASDQLYCELVRRHQYRIVYTPHAKVYHLLQRSTKELQKVDPTMYKTMFLKNSWDDLPEMRS